MNKQQPRRVSRYLRVEQLESRQMLAGDPVITEFLANNQEGLLDGDGESSDWIELYNRGDAPVDLAGYKLTDSADDVGRWMFPSKVLEPGDYLVVFASGRDLTDAGGNLHTSFRLSANGEYLALVSPDGKTQSEFGSADTDYPPQQPDVSFGFSQATVGVDAQSTSSYLVPSDDSLGTSWTQLEFDAAANGFSSGSAALGYEGRPTNRANFADLIETTLPEGTHAFYSRIEFQVDNARDVGQLTLRLNYDNGFIVYLNGEEVLRENAPDNPSWISTAPTGNRRDSEAIIPVEFDLSPHAGKLVDGRNVLAIHVLNNLSDNSDLLLIPQLIFDRPLAGADLGYLLTPTPGQANISIGSMTGPVITGVTDNLGVIDGGNDLVVTARASELNAPVASLTLVHRVMYDDEVETAMTDDGTGADLTAGDGIFSAAIPHASFESGQMVRWYVSATDQQGNRSRAPQFFVRDGERQSPEYYGAVVADDAVSSQLPIVQWFIEPGQERPADTRQGSRSSVFYGNEFYDNVFVRLRGGSSANQVKKSYKFRFNRGHGFRFDADSDRVSQFNLNTTYSNKDYVRQALTFETYDEAGVPGSESFPVRVERNGEFFSVAIFVEQPNSDLLAREGLDPDGALYKMFNTFTSSRSNVEKQTRQNEDNSDLQAFIDGMTKTQGEELRNFAFDNVNIPAVLNYLAATVITSNNDQMAKNYYLYRDTNGTGEWLVMPWDLDLTFGLHFMSNDSILDDQIFADKDAFTTFAGVTIWPSHPFVGDRAHPGNRSWNRLIDALYKIPEFREMYLRRLRTLMDELLQTPETPPEELRFEARLDELVELLKPDVQLDYEKWANPWRWGEDLTMEQAIERMKTEYFAIRRTHLYITHGIDNSGDDIAGIPHAQVGDPPIALDPSDFDVNPLSGNQDEEYIKLNNPTSSVVDISGWQLRGGVEFTFRPGTVIPASGQLYVSPNVTAFRARSTGPTGGQGLLVQGPYSGHLSNFGETIELVASDGTVISTITTPTMPSDVQRYLRITELNYHPVDDALTEFMELQNTSSGNSATTLDLTGVAITDGPAEPFVFPAETTLAPGDYLLVVQDLAAFGAANPQVDLARIAGTYVGRLSNAGERLKLDDATGSTILDFQYQDDWYVDSDGGGYSLVVADTSRDYNAASNWRPSVTLGGTPGGGDPYLLQPGDANRDGLFDQLDIVLALNGGKYLADEPATWSEGDWTGDARFNQLDIVALLQSVTNL